MVLTGRRQGAAAASDVDAFVRELGVTIVPFGETELAAGFRATDLNV